MGVIANPADAYRHVKSGEKVFYPDAQAHMRFQNQFLKYRKLAYAANELDGTAR